MTKSEMQAVAIKREEGWGMLSREENVGVLMGDVPVTSRRDVSHRLSLSLAADDLGLRSV